MRGVLGSRPETNASRGLRVATGFLPEAGWLTNRNITGYVRSETDRVLLLRKDLDQMRKGRPLSVRSHVQDVLADGSDSSVSDTENVQDALALIDGNYRPSLDPLRVDRFSSGLLEYLWKVVIPESGYPADEREGAVRALCLTLGVPPDSVAALPPGDRLNALGVLRSAAYEVAYMQSLLADREPLARRQLLPVLAILCESHEGWNVSTCLSALATQAFQRELDGRRGIRFRTEQEAIAGFQLLAKAKRESLAVALSTTQVQWLYEERGYDSPDDWLRRQYMAFPLYPADWGMLEVARVIERPSQESAVRLRGIAPAW